MYYIRVKEGKNDKLNKEDKMRISILISIYAVHFAFLNLYKNLKTLAPMGTERSAIERISSDKASNLPKQDVRFILLK